jgi:hypothetical protein
MTAEETTFLTRRHVQILQDRAVAAQQAGRAEEVTAICAELRRYRDWLAARAAAHDRVLTAIEAFETAWAATRTPGPARRLGCRRTGAGDGRGRKSRDSASPRKAIGAGRKVISPI